MITPSDVCGLVLAGGHGRRMQNPAAPRTEKGLLRLHGRPLVEWAINGMPADLAGIFISANHELDTYAQYASVVPDDPSFGPDGGPLAGVASTLARLTQHWLFVVPADVPSVPGNMFLRLCKRADPQSCQLVVAKTDLPQPLFMLVHVGLLPSLQAYLHSGQRQVQRWQREVGQVVTFAANEHEFFNINTPDDLCRAHELLCAPQPG